MNRSVVVVGAAGLLLGGFAVAAWRYREVEVAEVKAVVEAKPATLAPAHAPRLGDPAARVVIVEFFDPACEACAKFGPPVKEIVEGYPGRVQLVLRYAAFHQGSDMMVAILEASRRQDKYWQTLEIMFATQAEWASHHDPQPERIWPLLEAGGLDIARLRVDMTDPAIAEVLRADTADAARLGVRKTPSFFVNDTPLTSFGLAQLDALVVAKLAEAY